MAGEQVPGQFKVMAGAGPHPPQEGGQGMQASKQSQCKVEMIMKAHIRHATHGTASKVVEYGRNKSKHNTDDEQRCGTSTRL
eukprot:780527-Amphidinium_carterae.2